jgi:hypothetical protein
VGASPDATKLAGRPLAYLKRYGFEGRIHPVNPKHAQIDGVATKPWWIYGSFGARYQSKLFNPEFLRSKGLPTPPWMG